MKKFEYFISYTTLNKNGQTGLGSGVFTFDFNLDEQDYNLKMLSERIMSTSNDLINAVPLYYHLRRVIEE